MKSMDDIEAALRARAGSKFGAILGGAILSFVVLALASAGVTAIALMRFVHVTRASQAWTVLGVVLAVLLILAFAWGASASQALSEGRMPSSPMDVPTGGSLGGVPYRVDSDLVAMGCLGSAAQLSGGSLYDAVTWTFRGGPLTGAQMQAAARLMHRCAEDAEVDSVLGASREDVRAAAGWLRTEGLIGGTRAWHLTVEGRQLIE